MKPLRLLTALFLAAFFSSAPAQASLKLKAPSGEALELTARALQPGEVILVVWHKSPDSQSAEFTFLGKRYEFSAIGPAGLPFALVGIDLETRPGSYLIKAEFLKAQGPKELLESTIRLLPKTFPRKDIVLDDESQVIPPPEAAERIAREQQLLAKIYGSLAAEWLASGNFRPPLEGRPKQNFGEIRVLNKVRRSRHTGVDMDAEMGAAVAASNAGRVALAADLYFSGNTVILDHGLGAFSAYCHFSRLAVGEGQMVCRGDIIGFAGSTGRSTGPHLHWAVRLRGARVDPLSLLSLVLE